MAASMMEIVDLGNGEIVLQKSEEDSEPLVTIRFSEEAKVYLMDSGLEVARAMIQAGIEAVADIADESNTEITMSEAAPRTLH